MKNIICSFLCLTFIATNSLLAQDIITLKSGEEVKAKVLEIGTSDVKYKKFENQTGPSYTIFKSDIFMIKYENGTKDVFANTSPATKPDNNSNNNYNSNTDNQVKKQVEQGLKDNREHESYVKNMKLYKSKLVKGIVCTALGVPMVISGIALFATGMSYIATSHYTYINGYSYPSSTSTSFYTAFAVIGGVFLGVGIPLSIVGPINIRGALKYKRRAKEAKNSMSFEPILRPDMNIATGSTTMVAGAGMKIKF